MITCRDINNLRLDGVELLTGEAGLERMVSWTYIVQTKPYKDHMNPGNFALLVVDSLRYSIEDAYTAMLELNELGISGLAISVEEDKEAIPQQMIEKAKELKLSLFYIRWEGATFVDIAQSIGELILETEVDNKRTGDYLYNLLFGYEVNDKYIEKISAQFGLTFDRPYRVGVIVIDRKYGMNLEQDKETEHQIEQILRELDSRTPFAGVIHSTCILGADYTKPADFGISYQEAKNLIPKKDMLPNPTNKKVLSASSMGIYKYMFNSGNQQEILNYCNEKLKNLEMYDNANGSFLIDTLVNYYMCGFNVGKTAEMMYVHRNSLQYRLKKIEEILEINLDDSMEYLDLVNCILVKRLMFH